MMTLFKTNSPSEQTHTLQLTFKFYFIVHTVLAYALLTQQVLTLEFSMISYNIEQQQTLNLLISS